jgi:ribosomal protein S18 acetylase RimI-like enzyme
MLHERQQAQAMAPVIRRATATDADALARIGADTFVATFGHLYPAGDLQAFLDESHTAAAYARYLADDAYALWLLEAEGRALGYALAGPANLPHPDLRAGDGELKRLYVDASLQNGGWGGRLFAGALAWLEREGPRTLWISVWSENLGAQRFYARHGFGKAGEYEFLVGRQRDREFIFRRVPKS